MTFWTLILRSLRFHARAHLGVVLGAAVGSAVLTGALVVGDSIRASLRDFALARLGQVDWALAANDRFFQTRLADDLESDLGAPTAPGLLLPATAHRADNTARANRVQVVGVDPRFWKLGRSSLSFGNIASNSVWLNERLASQLHVQPGDTILLRVPKPSPLSREAPVSPQENASTALRLNVERVLTDQEFGRFSLNANQVPPFNAFVSLSLLQNQADLPGRANLLLTGRSNREPLDAEKLQAALRRHWQLADAQLELRALPGAAGWELRTSRVFLDPPIAQAALRAATNAQPILTYFVNRIQLGDRSTPYSIVTAMGLPVVPAEMGNDEILVNQWLADDLQAKPGDEIELTYYVVGPLRSLQERRHTFRIRGILPMTLPSADRTLMPDFPGLAKAQNCRDWDAGFPIELDRLRPKDQKYWDDYRGTPKAFITLATGRTLWGSRFGDLTAIRYLEPGAAADPLTRALRRALEPRDLGLTFQPVHQLALAASSEAQDFGQLFLGFSFFLIIAALLLMALLFQFGLEQRTTETGTLLALGYKPRQVRLLLLGEGCLLAALGSIFGALGGLVYADAMLYGLTTIWRDAVGTSALEFHVETVTLLSGAVAGLVVAAFTIWLVLRNQCRRPAHELLSLGTEAAALHPPERMRHKSKLDLVLAAVGAGLSFAILAYGSRHSTEASGAFFGAGALLLLTGLAILSAALSSLAISVASTQLTLSSLGLRNTARRRTRSLAIAALLACGSFLVIAVGAFRLEPVSHWEQRTAGTGGFALIGETALPIVHDLNADAGRDFYGVDRALMAGVAVVPMRVHEGDDASCLNLNRALTPRLLGVNPEALAGRGAFLFAETAKGYTGDSAGKNPTPAAPFASGESAGRNPWWLLNQKLPADEVPAIGDEASITWALGRKVGDTLSYLDERGRPFKLRLVGALANSILQGSLVIAENQFQSRFPSATGYRMFLIDAPPARVPEVSAGLSRALQDVGLELTPTPQRLAAFNAVQNTYLSTFQILGGLGLILGSVGLGVVVLRHVLERRGELALLLAVGYRPRNLKWLVISEHGMLLLAGLAIGLGAALIAVVPALRTPSTGLPVATLGITLAGVLASGLTWTWLATCLALRGRLLEALRNN